MPETSTTLETPFLTGGAPGPVEEKIAEEGGYNPNLVNPVAQEIYTLISPLTYADESLDFPLLRFIDGIGLMWNDLNEIIRDRPGPKGILIPGYAIVMTLSECPNDWLPWLGQFNGVTAPPETPNVDRELISAASGFSRGTPASIKAAIALKLTGSKRVDIFERSEGKAYKIVVVTYIGETPNEEEISQALKGEDIVPAGIVIEYKCVPGWIYEGIQATGKTYQQLKEEYAGDTYSNLVRKEP